MPPQTLTPGMSVDAHRGFVVVFQPAIDNLKRLGVAP
jgi:hypothetical protein